MLRVTAHNRFNESAYNNPLPSQSCNGPDSATRKFASHFLRLRPSLTTIISMKSSNLCVSFGIMICRGIAPVQQAPPFFSFCYFFRAICNVELTSHLDQFMRLSQSPQ